MSRSRSSRVPRGRAARGFTASLIFSLSLVVPALLLLSSPSRADEPGSDPGRARSWSFEAVSGPSFGGPVGGVEGAMRGAGFADTESGCFFGCFSISYPVTSDGATDRMSYWGAARRRLGRGRWHVGLGGGPTAFGSVSGYRKDAANSYFGVHVRAEAALWTLAPMAWFEPARGLRLGAGPAIHRADLDVGGLGGSDSIRSRSWKAGFVVEAAVTVPVDTPVFFVALAQYRFSADATTPAWATTAPSRAPVELPATTVRLSHGFVALGIGSRF